MDVRALKQLLLGQLEEVLTFLLPAGKRKGNYFHVGSVDGEEGDSLRVCLSGSKRGVWLDGSGGGDGDVLDLWQAVRNTSKLKEILPEVRGYLNVPDHQPKKTKKEYKPPKQEDISESGLASKVVKYLTGERGISKPVIESFGVMERSWGEPSMAFPYFDPESDELCMVKFIDLTKNDRGKKVVSTSSSPKPTLFGLNTPLVQEAERWIVIVEGEVDTMSYHEQEIPAVGVPFGAKGESEDGSSANDEWLGICYDWLSQFETIYLSMDMDAEGKAATLYLMKRLGRERCRIVELPHNDANKCLTEGVKLLPFIEEAKTRDPDDMSPAADKTAAVWELLRGGRRERKGIVPFDWPEDEFPFRLRPREGTAITGIAGHGKSNFVYQLTAWLAGKGEKVFIGSYEEPGDEILSIMAIQANAGSFARDEYQRFRQTAAALYENIFIHDYEGNVPIEKFFEYAEYAVKRYGCSFVILDSVSTTDVDLDDKTSVEKFAKRCQAFWKSTGCHLIIIAHPRKGYNEKEPPLMLDILGSAFIGYLFFNVLTIHRPSMEDYEEGDTPDAKVICSKQKVGGKKPVIDLLFDEDSYRIYFDMEDQNKPYIDLESQPF